MKKARIIILTISVILLFSCGPVPFYRTGAHIYDISVSARSDGDNKSLSSLSLVEIDSPLSRSITTYPLSLDTFYKDQRKIANRGTLLMQITPESFILDIGQIVLYNKKADGTYEKTVIYPNVMQPDGSIVPQHYDLAYSDDFIRDFRIYSSQYDGMAISFLPQASSTSDDGFYVNSVVGADLSVYSGSLPIIPVTEGLSGLTYMSFDELQPFETNDGSLGFVAIGSDIEEEGIQNPSGETGYWENPFGGSTGNGVSLYFKADSPIDFSPYSNPEIILSWNLENLLEIWDGPDSGTTSDNFITFSLSNPFPLSLTIRENSADPSSNSSDSTAPGDVIIPAIAGANSWNTIQWINPVDRDFKEAVIIRKAGSDPAGRSDGTEVYRSYIPNYVDSSGISGTDYHYRIFSVDYSGNYSTGVLLNQIQH